MKRWILLMVALLLVPALAVGYGESSRVCPACGNGSAGLFCSECGTQIYAETAPAAPEAGIERAAGALAYRMAGEFAETVQAGEYTFLPLYTPQTPQPMNAYLIIGDGCEFAVSNDGIYPLEEPAQIDQRLSGLLEEWAGEIEEASLGCLRFVGIPDEADILVSVCQTFPFSGNYSGNVKGYACQVTLKACQLTNPDHTVEARKKKSPPQSVSVRLGSTRFWEKPPEMKDSPELARFVSLILGWYGCEDRIPDLDAAQRALRELGLFDRPADGEDSAAFRYAVRSLQERHGLKPDGRIDKATALAMYYGGGTLRETAERWPGLIPETEAESDLAEASFVCPGCGRIYAAEEVRPYCAQCGSDMSAITPGKLVSFGSYEQDNDPENGPEPIEWIVLEVRDGSALLLSKYGLAAQPYHLENTDTVWEACSLRAWLNSDFLSTAFTPEEAEAILLTDVDNSAAQGCAEWDTEGGADTQDKVFLLSCAEAEKYLAVTREDKENIGSRVWPTAYALKAFQAGRYASYPTPFSESAGRWWLRSPGERQSSAAVVSYEGSLTCMYVSRYGLNDSICVRPAIWVRLGPDLF